PSSQVTNAKKLAGGRIRALPPECARPRAQKCLQKVAPPGPANALGLSEIAAPGDGRTPLPECSMVAVSRCALSRPALPVLRGATSRFFRHLDHVVVTEPEVGGFVGIAAV